MFGLKRLNSRLALNWKNKNFIWIDKESHLYLQHEKDKI